MCCGLSSCPAWCGSHHKSSVGHCRLLLLLRRTTQKPGFRPMMTTMAVMTWMMMLMMMTITAMIKMTPLLTARMAESQMMGRTPFYSPLHSMVSSYDDFYDDHDSNDVFDQKSHQSAQAWGAAFGAAASAASPTTTKVTIFISSTSSPPSSSLPPQSSTSIIFFPYNKKFEQSSTLTTMHHMPHYTERLSWLRLSAHPAQRITGRCRPKHAFPHAWSEFSCYHNDKLFRVIVLNIIMVRGSAHIT